MIIRIGGGISAREHRAVVNLLSIQGDGQRRLVDRQVAFFIRDGVVARVGSQLGVTRDNRVRVGVHVALRTGEQIGRAHV